MVGIQDRLQNLHVAIADIFEPDGQEEGSPPLCMRWLERSVCAAGTLNIFASFFVVAPLRLLAGPAFYCTILRSRVQ